MHKRLEVNEMLRGLCNELNCVIDIYLKVLLAVVHRTFDALLSLEQFDRYVKQQEAKSDIRSTLQVATNMCKFSFRRQF